MAIAYTVVAVLAVLGGIALYNKIQLIAFLMITLGATYLLTGSALYGVAIFGLYYIVVQSVATLITLSGNIKMRAAQFSAEQPGTDTDGEHKGTGQYL